MNASTGPADWDADAYHELSDPQLEWGGEVLARLELEGGETVLDAGCGTGRLTAKLLDRLPRGRVIGVDAAPSMIERAREELGGDDRVELLVQSLTALELDEPVDAVLSNATFHWITDHARLFARLNAVMRPGAWLEAQCGGEGNVAEWERAVMSVGGDERFRPYLRDLTSAWNFASVGDTQALLERAGFTEVSCWLEPKTVTPRDPREYVRVVGLAKHLEHLPASLHDEFVDAVVGSMPRPLTIQYVRLNISARADTDKGGPGR